LGWRNYAACLANGSVMILEVRRGKKILKSVCGSKSHNLDDSEENYLGINEGTKKKETIASKGLGLELQLRLRLKHPASNHKVGSKRT
jgi:hypothetical protein